MLVVICFTDDKRVKLLLLQS